MYLLGDTIHDIIQPKDEDGGLVGGQAVLIAASTLLYHNGSYIGLLGSLAYATVSELGTGTYDIAIDTSHVDFPGVGSYQVWYDDGLIGAELTGGVDYFGGPYVVSEVVDAVINAMLAEAPFEITDYEYDSLRRPISAVKTFDSGRVVDITLTYDANGKLSYSEQERES